MKKSLFSCIALFTLGQAAMAQTLPADSVLHPDGAPAQDSQPQKAPAKADTEATGYWVDAQSYYDGMGSWTLTEGSFYSYRANLAFDGSEVSITDLVDLNGWEVASTTPIEGTYDAAAKTITVSTPGYAKGRNVNEYTKYADMSYFGDDCAVALFSGDFTLQPDGQYGLETKEELVFDVSDDLTTLTPRSGFGVWVFDKADSSVKGCINYYQGGTISMEKMPDGAKLVFLPSSVHFEGANVTVGATLKQSIKLVNKGLQAANYTGSTTGDGLQLAAYRSIDAGTAQDVYVQLVPKTAGDFSGKAEVRTSNGATATLQVTAKVGEAPDFSQIVKEGDITFSIGSDFPFVVTDTITGFPVAVSTNKGSASTSTLFANITVPEGKVGVVSWKGIKKGSYGNGFNIQKNEEFVFDDTYSHGFDGGDFTDDLSNTLALPAGYYVIQFQNATNNDWNGTADVFYRAYLYDFSLRFFDQNDHVAVLKTDNLDFGSHYLDRLSVRDTLNATLINLGTEPLKVTSVDGNGAFSGLTTDAEAGFGEELPVQVAFESAELGEQKGSVTLNTNAGLFVVQCVSTNESIPVDYHPIVSAGDFSFNTSSNYPFAVADGKAYNSTAKMSDTSKDLNSFLDASFEVPEGKAGVLAWTGHNSSLDFFTFMDISTLSTGTRITLDGKTMKEFAGEDVDCSSTQFAPEDLTFGAGRHTVRFFYLKKDSQPSFDDRVDISNLSITYTDAVEGITATGREAIAEEYYTLDGRRIQQPQRGITLVKTRYADGSTQTVKVLR